MVICNTFSLLFSKAVLYCYHLRVTVWFDVSKSFSLNFFIIIEGEAKGHKRLQNLNIYLVFLEIHLVMLKQNNKKPKLLKLPRGLLEEVKKHAASGRGKKELEHLF